MSSFRGEVQSYPLRKLEAGNRKGTESGLLCCWYTGNISSCGVTCQYWQNICLVIIFCWGKGNEGGIWLNCNHWGKCWSGKAKYLTQSTNDSNWMTPNKLLEELTRWVVHRGMQPQGVLLLTDWYLDFSVDHLYCSTQIHSCPSN